MYTRYGVMHSTGGSLKEGGNGRPLPFANWVTLEERRKSQSKPVAQGESAAQKADLDKFMAALKVTLERDSDAAAIIHRLAFRADASSELGERARAYAAEVRQLSARIRACLPPKLIATGALPTASTAQRPEAEQTRKTIETLDPNAAKTMLIQYLLEHAATTREVLLGVGNGMNAKTIEMLCRKLEREKQKIVAFIDQHTKPRLPN